MIINIIDEDGGFVCDIDLKDIDIERIIAYSLGRQKLEGNVKEYVLPFTESDITELIQYAITSMLKDEIERNKK